METRRKDDARRPALPEKPETTIRVQTYGSPCGELLLGSFGESLCLCDWRNERHRGFVDQRIQRLLRARFIEAPSPLLDEAARQLDEYFAGYRRTFDIPLSFAGTEFQKTVWRALLAIPFGATVSYGELARRIGQPMRTARTRSRSSSPATASSAATVR